MTTESLEGALRLAVVRRRGRGATVMAFRHAQDPGAALVLQEAEVEALVHALANPEPGLQTIWREDSRSPQLELAL